MLPSRRPQGHRRLTLAATFTMLLLAGLLPQAARAAVVVKPWTPPLDSLTRVAASARMRFQRQKGDSVTGNNFDGYQLAGDMGRVMLSMLGKDHWAQAQVIEATMDSMGLDVEVRIDPTMKHMVFMLVRNPFMPGADGIGYIYWQRGGEIRMQGASYPPAHDCSVRFWYTGHSEVPYEALTLYRQRKDGDRLSMRLYRMNENGIIWNLVQYEGSAPDLGKNSTGLFADINNDGLPEVLAYHTTEPDSFFRIMPGAPQLLQEYTFTERPEGFVLHDSRDVPGPTKTVSMFASFLVNHENDLARRLLLEPAKLDSVLALGWGRHAHHADWTVEYGESQPWPEWLELKIHQDSGWQRWIFHFWIKDGRWVIRNWIPVQAAAGDSASHWQPVIPKDDRTHPDEEAMNRPGLTLAAVIALSTLASLAGCERRTQLVPASADSTHVKADSFTVFARKASERWEAGVYDEAAGMSARVVREALAARPNAPWVDRTRGLLDSLGIGAEVAGGDQAEVMNLFSRTDPQGESWPFLLWREQGSPRFQSIDGHGLHLVDVAARGFGPSSTPGDTAQTAVLWGRRVGGGQEPQAMVWHYAHGRWDLMQTLGADSLGGTGTGEFASTDGVQQLTVRTYKPTPYFDECSTCPHVFHERRFTWGTHGFTTLDQHAVPSPYSTFTAFIAALTIDDRDHAATLVVDKSLIDFARRFEWNLPNRGRWRVAPATDESAVEMVFLRGAHDAYRVRFESQDGDWLIAGFEPTMRAME